MTRVVSHCQYCICLALLFSFVYMQELKDRQNENYRQKSKSKQTENEMVFLERKMFWKVDKHKRNDQSCIFFRLHERAERSPEQKFQAKGEVKADRK